MLSRSAVWKDLSHTLSITTGRDFEREVLRLLKLKWPDLQQAKPLKTWDRLGVDLLVPSDASPLPCVVQCKGLEVLEINNTHKKLALDSISKFQESGISTDHYLLIHNRDGKNRDFANEIESALKKLLSSGSAAKVALWDRQRFLGEVFAFVGDLLEQRLREYSRQTLTRFQELFRFGRCRVSSVPVTESRMKLKRNSPAVLEEMVEQDALEISWHLKTQKGVPRWSILVGNFGLGKTAAALHLGIQSDRVVIHVPCAAIPGDLSFG